LITIVKDKFTYKTNLLEDHKPRVLVFNLKVHAQGDGINGKTQTQLFPSKITINGCDKKGVLTVTNNGWVVDRINNNPKRKKESIPIPDFKISTPYCPFSHYSISRDTSKNSEWNYIQEGFGDKNCNEQNDFGLSTEFANS
jgi:hypothetical protein